jgi:hypothetical protein
MNDALFIVLINSIVIIILKIISMFYKSKCKRVDCWGVHIERDIEAEEELDEQTINKGLESRSSEKL